MRKAYIDGQLWKLEVFESLGTSPCWDTSIMFIDSPTVAKWMSIGWPIMRNILTVFRDQKTASSSLARQDGHINAADLKSFQMKSQSWGDFVIQGWENDSE